MNGILVGLLIFAGIIALLYYLNILLPVLGLLTFIVSLFIFVKLFLKKYNPYEAAVIYRFGRFHRVNKGWTIVLPWIEKVGAVIDLREQKQNVSVPAISKEGLKVDMNALVYYYVQNPKNVVLNVNDFQTSFTDLVESSIRDIAADFNFTQLLVNVEHVAELLKQRIAPILDRWGMAMKTLEIMNIKPPESVMEALESVKVSEQNLAAKRFVAEARRIVTRALGEGTQSFDDRTITYLYVKALENMKSAKMLLPAEFMDVVHGQGGKAAPGSSNRLASGMIAGSTFTKALNMITDEVKKESVNKDNQEEEAAAGFDGMDGSFNGQYNPEEKHDN
ncbi:SPFH domain-containing protein [Candidatus Woesearchaeota archaeon]|nr:MAG: SPFH domain-containing protein [Candidatus Woesearchaeota archaeon]